MISKRIYVDNVPPSFQSFQPSDNGGLFSNLSDYLEHVPIAGTLDARANALAGAINGTGVQSLVNPCTVGTFYTASALGGTGVAAGANAGEVAATVRNVATTYWPQALSQTYDWLYRQALGGGSVANFILNIPKNYNKAKAAVVGGCNAMQ